MKRRIWKVIGTPTTTAEAAHFGRAPGARRVRGSTATLTAGEVAVLPPNGADISPASAVLVGLGRRRRSQV